MDAKGAIEFLDDMIGSFKCISSLNIKDINNKKNEIVYLLQQGEALKAENVELRAYKEMWGWLDNIINSYYGTE